MTIVVERRWSSLSERCCSAWSRTKWPARAADTSHVSGHFVRDDEEGDLETSAGDPRPRSGPAPLRRQSESRQLTKPRGNSGPGSCQDNANLHELHKPHHPLQKGQGIVYGVW